MKKAIYIFSFLALVLLGCDREDELPPLGIEGVYAITRAIDVNGIEQEDLIQASNSVYWFFEDRTFQKAQFEGDPNDLMIASGTFNILNPSGESEFEGKQFELVFLEGEELIEGCRPVSEVMIQTGPYTLVNEGHPCGEFNLYFNMADFTVPQ